MKSELLKDLTMLNVIDMLLDDVKVVNDVLKKDIVEMDEETDDLLYKLSLHAQLVEELDKKVKDKILEELRKHPGLKKVEGDKSVIGYTKRASKKLKDGYNLDNISQLYVKSEKKLDMDAVNLYYETTKTLPEGIELQEFEYSNYKPIEHE